MLGRLYLLPAFVKLLLLLLLPDGCARVCVHVGLPQAGRDPAGYRDTEMFKLCQRGMENLRLQMREARQAGRLDTQRIAQHNTDYTQQVQHVCPIRFISSTCGPEMFTLTLWLPVPGVMGAAGVASNTTGPQHRRFKATCTFPLSQVHTSHPFLVCWHQLGFLCVHVHAVYVQAPCLACHPSHPPATTSSAHQSRPRAAATC